MCCVCVLKPHRIPIDYHWSHFNSWRKWGSNSLSYWNGEKYIKMANLGNAMIGNIQISFSTYPSNQCDPDVLSGTWSWETAMTAQGGNGQSQGHWTQTPSLPLTAAMTLVKFLLSLTWPQMLHLCKEELGPGDLCNLETCKLVHKMTS